MHLFPRLGHPDQEGVLHISKALKHQFLIDVEEMRALLQILDPLIFITSEIVQETTAEVSCETFLSGYGAYVNALKSGQIPDTKPIRGLFSSIFTKETEILYAMPVGTGKYLIKAVKPVIQLQMHQFFFSTIDETFRPMVLGPTSVFWGLQVSYPQIYQDPKSRDFFKVNQEEFPNNALFATLSKWLRHETIPTPFIHEGKRTNSPIRLGKMCLPWINNHPQLLPLGIQICVSK